MKTQVITADTNDLEQLLQEPAQALRAGEIVAFPTETVYGLGANALNEKAVEQIFILKGRPQDNPLIVHLPDKAKIEQVAKNIPQEFYQLYEAFCPGPLTFVLEKSDLIPDIVSAGLDTVAVRFPDQDISQTLLRLADTPVVAPSANLSGRPSATRASHVLDDFKDKIPYIIDGGATALGLESTVLDLQSPEPRILRPGIITAAEIKERSGIEVQSFAESLKTADLEHPASPGLKYRHYAPNARVVQLCGDNENDLLAHLIQVLDQFADKQIGVFINDKSWEKLQQLYEIDESRISTYLFSAKKPHESAAQELFAALRALDAARADVILAEALPDAEAYMNRLSKACAPDDSAEAEVKTILFVCTGNTCRSPMAAALFNTYVEQKQPDSTSKWQALSAGLYTMDGLPASSHSISVLREVGIDIAGHRSVQLTEELLEEAEIVATMTRNQRDMLLTIAPRQKEKIKTLSEWARGLAADAAADVIDPYAQAEAVYRETRDLLQELIVDLWQELNTDSQA